MEKINYLSKENSNCLRGIFAIIIMLLHITQFHPISINPYVSYVIVSLGYLSVSVFFFFSGYGLKEAYLKKTDYLKNFFKHRILPTYGTYLLVMAIYLVCFLAVGRRFSYLSLLKSVLLYSTIVNNGWFFFALIVLYILFYVTHRFLKKHPIQMAGMILGLLLWCAACIYFDFGHWLYLSVFAYYLGMEWSFYKEKINDFAGTKKGWITGLCIIGTGFVITYLLGHMYRLPESIYFFFQTLSAIFFPALIMWLCMKIPVQCSVTKFLGKYSKYIYAMHGLVLNLFANEFRIESFYLYLLTGVFISILLAVIVQNAVWKIKEIRIKRIALTKRKEDEK